MQERPKKRKELYIMDIEQVRIDFEEICNKAEAFMKKYGDHNSVIVITKEEIKIMGTQLFRKFGGEKQNADD